MWEARRRLEYTRYSLGPEPLSPDLEPVWQRACAVFTDAVADVNKKVARYNMIVPTLRQQLIPYRAQTIATRVRADPAVLTRAPDGPAPDLVTDNPDHFKLVTFKDVYDEIVHWIGRALGKR